MDIIIVLSKFIALFGVGIGIMYLLAYSIVKLIDYIVDRRNND